MDGGCRAHARGCSAMSHGRCAMSRRPCASCGGRSASPRRRRAPGPKPNRSRLSRAGSWRKARRPRRNGARPCPKPRRQCRKTDGQCRETNRQCLKTNGQRLKAGWSGPKPDGRSRESFCSLPKASATVRTGKGMARRVRSLRRPASSEAPEPAAPPLNACRALRALARPAPNKPNKPNKRLAPVQAVQGERRDYGGPPVGETDRRVWANT